MEVFGISQGSKFKLRAQDVSQICPLVQFDNTHHEDRNSHPYSLDLSGVLLSKFEGESYRATLDALFQARVNAANSEPVTERKDELIGNEIRFWNAFSEPIMNTSSNRTSIFDLGVCGADASLPFSNDSFQPYSSTLLDHVACTIETKMTRQMELAYDPASVDPSLAPLVALSGPGKSSPFLLQRTVNECGSSIVAGADAFLSRCRRLVIENDELAWLSDLHHSYEFRRIVLCNHMLGIVGSFGESEHKARFRGRFFQIPLGDLPPLSPHVMYYMNRISRSLRGVRCDRKLSIHRPPRSTELFTDARSRWRCVRFLIKMRQLRCFPEENQIDSRPSRKLIADMCCGIDVFQIFLMALWKNPSAPGIDAARLVTELKNGKFNISEHIDDAPSLAAVEMLTWIETVTEFRKLTDADQHGGLFAVDFAALEFVQLIEKEPERCNELFRNVDADSVDEILDSVLFAATGVENYEALDSLCFYEDYKPPEKLAANFDNLRRKKRNLAGDRIRAAETWLLNQELPEEKQLNKSKILHIVKKLPSGGVISYPNSVRRKMIRALQGLRGFTAGGIGVNVDFSGIIAAGGTDCAGTMNQLLGGSFGTQGVRYGLTLIFRGQVKVRPGPGLPNSYVPSYAFEDNGVVLTAYLPARVMAKATYFERKDRVYWLPGRGLNVFRVEVNRKSRTTKFVERPKDQWIEEQVGGFKMRYKVG